MRTIIGPLLVASALATACASTPSARHPSAAEHDVLASNEESAAKAHLTAAQQHAPPRAACGGSLDSPGAGRPCWEDFASAQESAAAEHRHHAAEHRAASQALRDAEARACVGVSDLDRDTSPFAHHKDIVSVRELTEVRAHATPQLVGATVVFRPVQGLTAENLQQIVDCHVARNDAMGHVVPEEPDCPLVPPNVVAKVSAVPDGFRVDIRTNDDEAAREVLRRARTLVAH